MRNLYLGDSGITVRYLQLALSRAGYPLALDGIFGEGTCAALGRFLGRENICEADTAAWERLIPYLKGYEQTEDGGIRLFDVPLVSTEVPYTSVLTCYVTEGLAARYPFLLRGSIGRSVMGREIPYLQIGRASCRERV